MACDNTKNGGENENGSNKNIEPPEDDNNEDITEEYELLESTLDELNSALDFLERKNDDIHQQLKELLQSNIAIRQEMREENKEVSNSN
ncbi:UPF0184 protein AAEL002161 [Bombyx mandarina]|uniref:UPF0184 protein AAEL002161 n=1 Tax=Bombyx mandarina TaxID=7092 RepID=A0A6J2KFU9_BOMMA|nr:UPF0184 protein AAEL002161 [Bombyx mandarina]